MLDFSLLLTSAEQQIPISKENSHMYLSVAINIHYYNQNICIIYPKDNVHKIFVILLCSIYNVDEPITNRNNMLPKTHFKARSMKSKKVCLILEYDKTIFYFVTQYRSFFDNL
jgi:hypothetical protein